MDFVWGGERNRHNARLTFSLRTDKKCDRLSVCAADFYQVFADGALVSYGPRRTAAGYSRKRDIDIRGAAEIKISVTAYNIPCYECDLQLPFFGAEVFSRGKKLFGTKDFICGENAGRKSDMPRYSSQRGWVEGFDFTEEYYRKLSVYPVPAPIILEGFPDPCDYACAEFKKGAEKPFEGFDEVLMPGWEKKPRFFRPVEAFSTERDFIAKTARGFTEKNYTLERESTGFITLETEAEKPAEIFVAFEEFLPGGKWVFRRSCCNDYLYIKVPAGRAKYVSEEPYALKYLKIISGAGVKATPALIKLQNDRADCVSVRGDRNFVKIFEAAKNTFCQNAYDIFMDCPGRERAGWLCDSYFTAIAERLFTGENRIERDFLENIIIAETPEIPAGMIPKCFPAEHYGNLYIPNWAMWFAIEVREYCRRTGDADMAARAKEKIYDIINFFDKYVNEHGLLEDLESWVFVEWSVSNAKEYIKGVNFPTNMLFAYMLENTAALYGDGALRAWAESMRGEILRLSFDGCFFADNAVREGKKLAVCREHISETCQYYALFTEIFAGKKFEKKMAEEFGPFRTSAYPEIGRSNMFIGNYLRFFWLCRRGERDRVLKECIHYFSGMAEKTGTLWEHDKPFASCNHGFASVAAAIMLHCACGYVTVKNGQPIFLNGRAEAGSGVSVNFDYNGQEKARGKTEALTRKI